MAKQFISQAVPVSVWMVLKQTKIQDPSRAVLLIRIGRVASAWMAVLARLGIALSSARTSWHLVLPSLTGGDAELWATSAINVKSVNAPL